MDPGGEVGNLKDFLNLSWTLPRAERFANDEPIFNDSKEITEKIGDTIEVDKKGSEIRASDIIGIQENHSHMETSKLNGSEENKFCRYYLRTQSKTEINYHESDLSDFLCRDTDWRNRFGKKKINLRKKGRSSRNLPQRKYSSEPFPMRYNLRNKIFLSSRTPSLHSSSVEMDFNCFQNNPSGYILKEEIRRNDKDTVNHHPNKPKLKVKYGNSSKHLKSSSKYKEIERKLKIKLFFVEISSTINNVEEMLSDWKHSLRLPNVNEASKLLKKLYEINLLLKDEYSGIQFKRDQLDILETILDFLRKIENLQSTLKKRIKKLNRMKLLKKGSQQNIDPRNNQNCLDYIHDPPVGDVNNCKDDSVKEPRKTESDTNRNNYGGHLATCTSSIQSKNTLFTGPENRDIVLFEIKEPPQLDKHSVSFSNSWQKNITEPSESSKSLAEDVAAEVAKNEAEKVEGKEILNNIAGSPTLSLNSTRNMPEDLNSIPTAHVTDELMAKPPISINVKNVKQYRKPLLHSKSGTVEAFTNIEINKKVSHNKSVINETPTTNATQVVMSLNTVNVDKSITKLSGEDVSHGAKEILNHPQNIRNIIMNKKVGVLDFLNTPNQGKESSKNKLIIVRNNENGLDREKDNCDIVKLGSTIAMKPLSEISSTETCSNTISNQCSNLEQKLQNLPLEEIEIMEIETIPQGATNEKLTNTFSNGSKELIVNSPVNKKKLLDSRSEIDILPHVLPLNLLNSFEKINVTNTENCIKEGWSALQTSSSTIINENNNRQKETNEIQPLDLLVNHINFNKNNLTNNFSKGESTFNLDIKTNCHTSFSKESNSSKGYNNEKLLSLLTSDCEEIVADNINKPVSNSENLDLDDLIPFNVNTEEFLQPCSLDLTEQSKLRDNPSTFNKECVTSNIFFNSLMGGINVDPSTNSSTQKNTKIASKLRTTSDFQTEKTIIHSNDRNRSFINTEKLNGEDSSKMFLPNSNFGNKLADQMLPSFKVSTDCYEKRTALANTNPPLSSKDSLPAQQKLSPDSFMSRKENSLQNQSKPIKKANKSYLQSGFMENPFKDIKYLRIISESELIDPEEDDNFMSPSNYVW